MFKTLILMCVLGNPYDCYQFSDLRGPYQTRDECVARAGEMIETIIEIEYYPPADFKYRCDKVGTAT
jgi:hypothetical protein